MENPAKVQKSPEEVKAEKFRAKVMANERAYNMTCAKLGQAVYRQQVLEWEINSTERAITSYKSQLKEINEKAAKYSKVKLSDNAEAAKAEDAETTQQPNEVSNEPQN